MSLSIKVHSFTAHGGLMFEITGETPEEHALLRSVTNAPIRHWVGNEQVDGKGPIFPALRVFLSERPKPKEKKK